MTLVMEAGHRQLPPAERYPLPPRQISDQMLEAAGVREQLDEEKEREIALLSHFAFGAAMGALYAGLAKHAPMPSPLAGAAWGLTVWGANYLGILPALGLQRPVHQKPPRRVALMIGAHLVWGVATALVVDALDEEKTDPH
jgi:uncharacterized membrane protein YagU involved in acid resistance